MTSYSLIYLEQKKKWHIIRIQKPHWIQVKLSDRSNIDATLYMKITSNEKQQFNKSWKMNLGNGDCNSD